jgi:catechol 2,3-dioxygenase-like lactoylglutathione lyase family enzyme
VARIRHIAIATRDPKTTAQFYIEGLGLKEVGKVNSPTAEGYYLSDGHVNLAILDSNTTTLPLPKACSGTPVCTTSASRSRT